MRMLINISGIFGCWEHQHQNTTLRIVTRQATHAHALSWHIRTSSANALVSQHVWQPAQRASTTQRQLHKLYTYFHILHQEKPACFSVWLFGERVGDLRKVDER
jgi:hypothetical protein